MNEGGTNTPSVEVEQKVIAKSELLIPSIITCILGWAADATFLPIFYLLFPVAVLMVCLRLFFLPKNLKDWFYGIFVVCFSIAILSNHFPAIVSFKLAQSNLESAKRSLESDERLRDQFSLEGERNTGAGTAALSQRRLEAPFFAGFYRIYKVERLGSGDIGFWFSQSGGNRIGFAYSQDENVRLNIASKTKVGENWYLVSED